MRLEFVYFDVCLFKFLLKCFFFFGVGDWIVLLLSIFLEICYFIIVVVLEEILNWEVGEEVIF